MSTHNAPPVSYSVGRSCLLAVLLAAGWGLVWLVCLAWGLAGLANGLVWGALALVLSGGGLYLGWRRVPAGNLSWDGQGWLWQSSGYAGSTTVQAPELVLDLQRLVLIRMHNQAGVAWLLWADAARQPADWLDFRRALVSRPHNAAVASGPERDPQP